MSARLSRSICRALAAALLAVSLLLAGCGGGLDTAAAPLTTTTVIVEVLKAGTTQYLDVVATVVVGGITMPTDLAQGWAIVENVPLGTQTPPQQPVTVSAPGYRSASRVVQLSTYTYTSVSVELTPVDLTVTGTLTGTVTDVNSGTPLANVLVTVTPGDGSDPLIAYTDRQGHYQLGGVPFGSADVLCQVLGYLDGAATVEVQPDSGGTNPAQDFTLYPGTTRITVTGVVLEAGTEVPVSAAEVTLGDYPPVATDAQGHFSVPQVLVGQQNLTATHSGYDPKTVPVSVFPGMAALTLYLVPASPAPPPGPYTITGLVTLVNRPDNGGATVTAQQQVTGETMGTTTTNATGRYYLYVPPGPYRITVQYGSRSLGRDVVLGGGGRVLTGIDFTLTIPPG